MFLIWESGGKCGTAMAGSHENRLWLKQGELVSAEVTLDISWVFSSSPALTSVQYSAQILAWEQFISGKRDCLAGLAVGKLTPLATGC